MELKNIQFDCRPITQQPLKAEETLTNILLKNKALLTFHRHQQRYKKILTCNDICDMNCVLSVVYLVMMGFSLYKIHI
ncbi:hypothetical protein [Samia cynthia nucleopolyhedrovirus]|uniref:Uncharacterized protein n=2 Tax=Antheraea pernyi nuclear polyhedrosis virus TaxID=161494 RepID=A8C682_NPVAP|nr:unknown [Antheraea pernyi nucleopolyhedrovirus]AWD33614.1 hypothetical protein [Antheraea proylei nucleopolyhedrovirus]BBD50551.1 hypothetical protein [Antheraea yamamai nucleopolyhedrovirus]BBD50703.1 hypothetical protein [Samia cynthia nucleopolyhedrovirus]AYW35441.1 hypothetical protein [Antheraea proylei nucleopolyhedrovirus]